MRPFRSFLLLLILLTCFTGLYYIAPGNIKLPGINDFIPVNLTDFFLNNDTISSNQFKEVVPVVNVVIPDSSETSLSDSSIGATQNLKLFQTLIDSLQFAKSQIRIMYYGDSQIEGDRVTSYLRQSLRKGKGGTGPGLFLPLMPVMYSKSVYIRSSANWKRYNYLSFKNKVLENNELGPFMTICRFLPPGTRSDEPVKASIRIVPSVFADSSAIIYDNLRIFYGNTRDVVNIRVSDADNQIYKDTLSRGVGINELNIELEKPKDLRIDFEGSTSPDIYGLSIESKYGVVVDNIPQRGSAGLEFTMVGKKNLKEIYDKLKPDLFILHYGLNIVRNIRDDYSYYESGLLRQILLLKEICPEAAILVLSVTDMAYAEGDSIKSFPNIPKIRDAQKNAAGGAGVAFWDSYEAMGGKLSSVKWAREKSPLISKDYVHFTYPGADTISKMLFQSMFIRLTNDSTVNVQKTAITDSLNLIKDKVIIAPEKQEEKISFLKVLISDILSYNPDKPFIFTSPAFWVFFLLVLAGYCFIYRKLAVRNIYLFLISLFFYFKTGGLFLLLLIFVTVIDYTTGLLIHRAGRKWTRKGYLLLSLISNLGLLAYFKYAAFIIGSVNELFGTELRVYDMLSVFSNNTLGTSFDISYIILPVGISFFTFQSLSYTIDVYRKKMEPVRNIIDFGFYVSFFPHLVAGPIVRASVFIPQIYQEFHVTRQEFGHSLFMISKGLIKKIVISNFIAVYFVDRVFDAPALYSGFENLMAIYGYGLQIYCDFSGYTDIAIGVALILGFRLPVNFNSPYKATSITDFWKRWHISLSQWLKDYLYISLGGNRKGKIRTGINLMITMLLGGLWHGASLRFIIWGALHGIGLVFSRIWESVFGNRFIRGPIGKIIAIFITFQFVSFCWIFFRAENMDNVFIMLRQIGQNFSPGSYTTVLPAYGNVFLLMSVGYIMHFLPERVKESYRGLFIKIPLVVQLIIIMLIGIMLYQMKTSEVMPFIYFRF
jgi:alginate O-acetyltransferase complex protein AlgI